MTKKEIEKLQKEENKIWQELDDVLSDDHQRQVGRLIEINLLLEAECNK